MKTIIKYVLIDLLKNRTILIYTLVLAVLTISVTGMSDNMSKGMLSLLNITLLFVPIISILFATIYFFNSAEFTELLLAQPIRRKSMLLASYTGIATALGLAYLAGVGVTVCILYNSLAAIALVVGGVLLTLIFSALALLIFVVFKDKTRGIGAAIITALFFTLLFDGLLLAFIYSFSDYPIDEPLLAFISLNPVDLARILVLLQLDAAVMMGYSGALFKKFMGSATGSIYTAVCMLCWMVIPLILAVRVFRKKDI
ncbi:Cu-processing system permease protein [Chitinophaga eiseniae]|uniref:Cu-processing system permease protein n=1 Tax=Chitinophaga eiseniae TaxID=634771 RepID=A0A1T4MAH2_9BACT|nr:ABC transporter permease subunit [Chitinophaga eiseniae]SJZ63778.1 Cu-processing system permease protein [Chitinophaga eiseniae]